MRNVSLGKGLALAGVLATALFGAQSAFAASATVTVSADLQQPNAASIVTVSNLAFGSITPGTGDTPQSVTIGNDGSVTTNPPSGSPGAPFVAQSTTSSAEVLVVGVVGLNFNLTLTASGTLTGPGGATLTFAIDPAFAGTTNHPNPSGYAYLTFGGTLGGITQTTKPGNYYTAITATVSY